MDSFERKRIDYISKDDVLAELRRVADIYYGQYFGRREFDKNSQLCKGSKVISIFGSWQNALNEIGIESTPIRKARKDKIEDEDLLLELNRVWDLLGHRPSKAEWETIKPKYSYTTYKSRFEGWVNACNEAFNVRTTKQTKESIVQNNDDFCKKFASNIKTQDKRNIPLKLRLTVLKRDHFKCVLCGRSPSTDPDVELHIDHIVPFSLNGKTEFNNLRTLCRECNLGKGNDANL
jgi:hypothetical protein